MIPACHAILPCCRGRSVDGYPTTTALLAAEHDTDVRNLKQPRASPTNQLNSTQPLRERSAESVIIKKKPNPPALFRRTHVERIALKKLRKMVLDQLCEQF